MLLLVTLLALCPATAYMEEDFPSGGDRPQVVRVCLTRLRVTNRVDITLDGIYGLGRQGEVNMLFERGSRLTLLMQNGSLVVYYKGMTFQAGPSLYLTRYAAADGQENGIRVTGEPALYLGDMQLDVEGDVIRPVLHIHVEDYLLGVVPHEMNNTFPLEALKAQAVTARTYALRRQDPAKPYDLVDTTNDQVFRGYLKGYDRVSQAIRDTRGVCGFFKNQLAECFYGASNGGQTELVEHVWGGGDYGYYAMTDDPYDLENPASLVKSFAVKKMPGKGEVAGHGLRALLVEGLRDELVSLGYDPDPESLRVDEVTALSVDTPAFPPPSRLMTKLHITLKYSGRTRTDGEIPASADEVRPASIAMPGSDDEDVSLFSTPTPIAVTESPLIYNEQERLVTPNPTPVPTPQPVYGPFEPAIKEATLEFSVFPDAINALSLGIQGGRSNEMLTVVENKDRFVLESRRYGHGVGMSQRGAEWMAMKYQKTYRDILTFYYPGMTLKQYADRPVYLVTLSPEQLVTPGPPPTPTPRPTLMPVTEEAKDGSWYALVTGIEDDSTLNLRSAPDLSGEILMRIFRNQRLLVLEQCQEEGWVKVKTDVIEGYVMESFLQREE